MVLHFAHRGSLTEAPENTLSVIKKAIDLQLIQVSLPRDLDADY